MKIQITENDIKQMAQICAQTYAKALFENTIKENVQKVLKEYDNDCNTDDSNDNKA